MRPLNGQTPIVYCIGKPTENLNVSSFFAYGPCFTNFPHVLPTSRVGCYAWKLIESAVYCLASGFQNSKRALTYEVNWKAISRNDISCTEKLRTLLEIDLS